jgi:hypothetical protein
MAEQRCSAVWSGKVRKMCVFFCLPPCANAGPQTRYTLLAPAAGSPPLRLHLTLTATAHGVFDLGRFHLAVGSAGAGALSETAFLLAVTAPAAA